ncbi:hypothetical protein [Terriglobus roseus]|uniref:hypothetical protein n=1 Tax=Terriglobus roseus TaxID=392734 RepID=UPI0012EA1957|nr:hypothetical protein [Terriglobus roseus]
MSRREFVVGSLLVATGARAQQLAHAGWRGNGITPEVWWLHASMIRCAKDVTFADAAKMLDSMSDVGADSILLPDLEPTAKQPFAERFGTEEELDALLREMSARRMHLLLHIPLQRAASNAGEVRFWMSRGVAGIDLGTLGAGDMDAARQLRASLDHYPGHRILLARTAGQEAQAVTSAARRRGAASGDPITLHILSPQDTESGIRHPGEVNAVEIPAMPVGDEKADAAAAANFPAAVPYVRSLFPLLLASGSPILDSRLLTSDMARKSVQQVLAFRNTHAVVRDGSVVVLTTAQPSLRVWILRSKGGRGSLLLAANDGTTPANLLLTSALASNGFRNVYLRPLMRSDRGMGAINVEIGSLPPGSAIVAEILH